MRAILIVMILFFSVFVEANVAVDQIHTLLKNKKETQVNHQAESTTLKDLRENYYMVYIFKSSCPHCKKTSPILKNFSEYFKIKVKGYTIDNQSIPEFKATPLTPELFQVFYISGGFKTMVPAVYLVNKHTKQVYPALFGEFSSYQLANRTHELMTHIKEKYDV